MPSFTIASTRSRSSAVMGAVCAKSKRSRSGATREPRCTTCSPRPTAARRGAGAWPCGSARCRGARRRAPPPRRSSGRGRLLRELALRPCRRPPCGLRSCARRRRGASNRSPAPPAVGDLSAALHVERVLAQHEPHRVALAPPGEHLGLGPPWRGSRRTPARHRESRSIPRVRARPRPRRPPRPGRRAERARWASSASLEAPHVHLVAPLLGHELRQVQREAEGVVEPEGLVARDPRAGRGRLAGANSSKRCIARPRSWPGSAPPRRGWSAGGAPDAARAPGTRRPWRPRPRPPRATSVGSRRPSSQA